MNPPPDVVDPCLAPFAFGCRYIMGQRAEDIDPMPATTQGGDQKPDGQCGETGEIVQIDDQKAQTRGCF